MKCNLKIIFREYGVIFVNVTIFLVIVVIINTVLEMVTAIATESVNVIQAGQEKPVNV